MSRNHCILCGSDSVKPVTHTGPVPVLCNQLCRTRTAALSALKATVSLGYCSRCGHIHNLLFDEKLVRYSPEYENSLHFSGQFAAFARTLADELTQRHQLESKRIVEVGCGNGEFLCSLCRTGGNDGFGFDMSYGGGNTNLPPNVQIFNTVYGSEHKDLNPDLVCARHVLEHVSNPVAFLTGIRRNMQPGSALYVEVPNALYTLRDGGVWDIIYEHCSYFTPDSLNTALSLAGFSVELTREAFDGQFLCAHARALDVDTAVSMAAASLELKQLVTEFVCSYGAKINSWRSTLAALMTQNRRVVAWGAGSKGSTFANLVAPADMMPYVVDQNPRKHGMFVAGTGARIVPPEFLVQYEPHDVVILNPYYQAEVRQRLEDLGISPEVRVA